MRATRMARIRERGFVGSWAMSFRSTALPHEGPAPLDFTPVMAGGTGRSGTTVIAGLLGKHSDVRASRPREVKIVTEPVGLLDLCLEPSDRAPAHIRRRMRLLAAMPWSQRWRLAAFAKQMRGRWWLRSNRKGRASGLHLTVAEEDRERLIRELAAGLPEDPLAAGREFFCGIVRAQSDDAGESHWVDTSPPNIAEADRIHRLLPEAKFIRMVRDGRSTAASVMAERWGPDDPERAISWWERQMRAGEAGLASTPDDAVLTVSLEDLVVLDREATYARVLDFLELDDDPRMRRFFEHRMPPERVGLDSWRQRVPDPVRFDAVYEEAAGRLAADGIEVFARG